MVDTIFAFLFSLFFNTTPPTAADSATTTAAVVTVIDGDTIDVMENGERVRVRYIGVDAPEYNHETGAHECFAAAATAANRSLVAGREVELVRGTDATDDYGRTLAYVSVDGESVNDALVAGGFATALPIEPNTRYARRFYEQQQHAKEIGAGLWKSCPRN